MGSYTSAAIKLCPNGLLNEEGSKSWGELRVGRSRKKERTVQDGLGTGCLYFGVPWLLQLSLIDMGSEKQLILAPSFVLWHLHTPNTKFVQFWSHSFNHTPFLVTASCSTAHCHCSRSALCEDVLWCLSVHSYSQFLCKTENKCMFAPLCLFTVYVLSEHPDTLFWCWWWDDQRR